MAACRPKEALTPGHHGRPPDRHTHTARSFTAASTKVTEAVLADPGLAEADEIVLFLPPAFGLAENVRLLTDLARTAAEPRLVSRTGMTGWDQPAMASPKAATWAAAQARGRSSETTTLPVIVVRGSSGIARTRGERISAA